MRWYNSTSYLQGKNSFQNITFQLVASHHQVEFSMVTPSQKQLVTGLTKTLCCPKNPDTIPLSQSWQKQYTQFLEWSVYCLVFIKILQNNQNFLSYTYCVTNVIARPDRPARAVRPTLWI
jgi:hypothetical protein